MVPTGQRSPTMGGALACENGRTRLSPEQDRRLFSESAGTCLLCNKALFIEPRGSSRPITIAERAHIVAHSAAGPRGGTGQSASVVDDPGNLVLLCPSCHTEVDKAPDAHPVSALRANKAVRAAAVARAGGTPTFSSRQEARQAVEGILNRNLITFTTRGPDSATGSLPSTEAADRWTQAVLEEIVPGNDLIVAIVELNPDLVPDGAQSREPDAAELAALTRAERERTLASWERTQRWLADRQGYADL
jgi:hypothetical protein